MSRTQIFGIGSPSGDDQAGWLVVDALESRLPADVRTARLDRPGSALIPRLQGADRVILVDAMQGGGMLGDIRHFAEGAWAEHRSGVSSHGFGVFEALMLARQLDCLPRQLDLYGIEIGSSPLWGEPSENIRSAALALANRIRSEWE